MLDFLLKNYIEILAVITALIYLYFQYKENIWLWLFGLISSAIYVYISYISKIYADMTIYLYYVIISIYGWLFWKYGKRSDKNIPIKIIRIDFKVGIILSLFTILLFFGIYYILKFYTDSEIPILDSITTSLSITATWMLTKKHLQHWLVWIVADSISSGLYIYKELYFTGVLYAIYTIVAIFGYFEWKKKLVI